MHHHTPVIIWPAPCVVHEMTNVHAVQAGSCACLYFHSNLLEAGLAGLMARPHAAARLQHVLSAFADASALLQHGGLQAAGLQQVHASWASPILFASLADCAGNIAGSVLQSDGDDWNLCTAACAAVQSVEALNHTMSYVVRKACTAHMQCCCVEHLRSLSAACAVLLIAMLWAGAGAAAAEGSTIPSLGSFSTASGDEAAEPTSCRQGRCPVISSRSRRYP